MSDPIISRGFRGRVPPGQYTTDDFPVLSAGPTPHTPLDQWDFTIVSGFLAMRSPSTVQAPELAAVPTA